MKWVKKKPLSPFSSSVPNCSPPSSLISHVFPVSWLSKLKHKNTNGDSESKTRKLKPPQGKFTSHPSKCPGLVVSDHGNFEFYNFEDDGDAFWRLSFGHDNAGEKSKRVGLKLKQSFRYRDLGNDDEMQVSCSNCPNCGRKQAQNLSAMIESKREGEPVLIRSPRRAKSSRALKSNTMKRSTCPGLGKVAEEEFPENEMSFDMQSLSEILKLKSEEQKKALHVSVEKQKKRTKQRDSERVKAYSPRAETCKVKALEDKRKAKLMKKKMMKERMGLDSFAVEKSSYDPRKDFKESMIEMILEKKMRQPEELEELLACYLTLNSDELHGLIIKAFREVWLELSELEIEPFFSD